MSSATTERAPEQGLEKFDPKAKTPELITAPDQYSSAIQRWKHMGVNVITPFAQIGGLAQMHAIRWSAVQLDPNPAAGDVYSNVPWLKNGQVAMAKKGLRAIADGLGLSIKLEHLAVERRYWHIKAIATYTNLDGREVTREASEQLDYNDGADDLKGFTPNQISEARKHGLRVCESKAINAVIRECGVKQAYTPDEIKRPFISIRVSFEPDVSDPDTKRILTQRWASGTSALYAPAARPALRDAFADDPTEEPTSEARTVGRGSTVQTPASPASSPDTTTDQPPEGAVRIIAVKPVSGTKGNKPWKKWDITDNNGETCSTFDEKLMEAAEKAKASGAWVELSIVMSGDYRNLEEIAPAGQQPGLPIDVGNL
jgi:hypothetical protein